MKKNSLSSGNKNKSAEALQPGPIANKEPFFRRVNVQCFGIVLLCFILYGNTLGFDYNLDDGVVITGNKFTKQGIEGIPEILIHDTFYGYFGKDKFLEEGRYRPFTQILFAIQYEIFGLNPFIGHLCNIIFYSFNCILLLLLLRRIVPRTINLWNEIVLLSVLFYCAHPLHTEVVANIKGLDEIFSFSFSLLCLHFTLNYFDNNKLKNLLFSFIFFFIALMSKENAVTFIVIVPLIIYFIRESALKKYILCLAPLIAAFIFYLLIRFNALGFLLSNSSHPELLNDPFLEADVFEKYATIMFTWAKYYYLLIFPHPLTHDYYPKQIPIINWMDWRAIVPFIISIGLVIFAFIKLKKKSIASFLILFFFASFSIASNLIVSIGTFMNERFMYVPSLAFCIALAWLLIKLAQVINAGKVSHRHLLLLTLLILLPYSIKTIARNKAWKDGYTLFTTDVKVSTNSAKCNTSAGGLMMEKALTTSDPRQKQGLLDTSVVYLQKAASLHPLSVNAWVVLGRAHIELNNLEQAELATENCLKILPSQPHARNNLLYIAQQYTKNERWQDALRCYNKLLRYEISPHIPLGIADVLELSGKQEDAIRILDSLIILNPPYLPALSKLAEIYGKKRGELDKALGLYQKYYSLNRTDVVVLENLGVICGMQKKYPESIRYLQEAIAIQPGNSNLYRNLASSYNGAGKVDSAQAAINKAMVLESGK